MNSQPKVVPFHLSRPRTYTSAKSLIEQVRQEIFRDGSTYKVIAGKTNVSTTTIGNLASGKTRWPRPTTLFPLLTSLGLEMRLVKSKGGE